MIVNFIYKDEFGCHEIEGLLIKETEEIVVLNIGDEDFVFKQEAILEWIN